MNYPTIFPTQLYIEANFMDFSLVAGKFSPLLKLVNLNKTNQGEYITMDFGNSLEFYPIRKFDLRVLDFKIFDNANNLANFMDNSEPIFMSLTFKKF